MRSAFQVDLLTRYRSFRNHAPTVGRLARRNALPVGGWCCVLLALAALLWWLEMRLAAAGVLGFMASTLFHAFASYYRTRDVWPVVERITDWDTVERLAGEARPGNSP